MVLTFFNASTPRVPARTDPDPSQVDKLAHKAAFHAARGEHYQAIAAYRLALLTDQGRADIWFSYATLQRGMGLLNDAIESLEFALREEPGLYAARYCMGLVLEEVGRPLAAQEQFRRVTLERPGYAPAWARLVELTCAIGEPAAARDIAHEALNVLPNDPAILALLDIVARELAAPRDPTGWSDMQGVPQRP